MYKNNFTSRNKYNTYNIPSNAIKINYTENMHPDYRLMNKGLKSNYTGNILDKVGLQKAYNRKDGLYQNNDVLYVAGTKSLGDVWDDIKLPFDAGAKNSTRYQDLKNYLKDHPEVKSLVGHSLGGATVLQENKDNPNKYNIVTYGSPGFNPFGGKDPENVKIFRNAGDPISMFDGKAGDMRGNKFNNLNYISSLIKNQINPLDPLRFIAYSVKKNILIKIVII